MSNILKKFSNNKAFYLVKDSLNRLQGKFSNRMYLFYENWIIPPQNETLLELKRREFKERTKYLDPKILYNLSEEEKRELRESGYFVDLDNKTIREIKNFKISNNRHMGKYRIQDFYYNFSLYNTKYYYMDQQIGLFQGDPNFLNKAWRFRSKMKRFLLFAFVSSILIWINYHRNRKRHIEIRRKIKNNDNSIKVFKYDLSK